MYIHKVENPQIHSYIYIHTFLLSFLYIMLLILAILKLVISNHTECMVAMKEYFDLPEIA